MTARPRSLNLAWLRSCAVISGILAVLPSASHTFGQTSASIKFDLLIELRCEEAVQWDYLLRLGNSEQEASDDSLIVRELRNFSADPHSSGIFDQSADRRSITIRSTLPILGAKFRVGLECTEATELTISRRTSSDLNSRWIPIKTFSVDQLMRNERITVSDQENQIRRTWTVQHQRADALQINGLQAFSVMEPGSVITATISTDQFLQAASKECFISYELHRLSDGELVTEQTWPLKVDAAGNSESINLQSLAPDEPGVYEARFCLIDEIENFWSKLTRQNIPLIQINRALVVRDQIPNDESTSVTWKQSGKIEPTETVWFSPERFLAPNVGIPIRPRADIVKNDEIQIAEHDKELISVLPASSSFQARIPGNTKEIQRFSLRIPSAAHGDIEVKIGKNQETASPSISISCDPHADHQGRWRTYRWLHYPTGSEQIWLTNLSSTEDFQFQSIIVESKKRATKPAIPYDGTNRIAALRVSDEDWIDAFSIDHHEKLKADGWDTTTIELSRLWTATQRLQQEVSERSCNAVVLGVNRGYQTWYRSREFASHHSADRNTQSYLDTILNLFDGGTIRVFVEFDPSMSLPKIEKELNSSPELQQEFIRQKKHRQRNLTGSTKEGLVPQISSRQHQYQLLNPKVQKGLRATVEELANRCKPHSSFEGIVLRSDRKGHLAPFSNVQNEPSAILLFARENNLRDDLKSIAKTHGDSIIEWVQKKRALAYQDILNGIVDKKFFIFEDGELRPEHEAKNGIIIADSYRTIAPVELATYLTQKKRIANSLPAEAVLFSAPVLNQTSHSRLKESGSGRIGKDLAKVIEKQNPSWLFLDYQVLNHQTDQLTETNLRTYCALPVLPMKEVDPDSQSSHTAKVQTFVHNNRLHVRLASIVPWDTEVDLETVSPNEWVIVGDTEDESIKRSEILVLRPTRSRIRIPAGEIMLLRSNKAGDNTIRLWNTRVAGGPEVVKLIKRKVTTIVEKVGTLHSPKPTQGRIRNGGFEQQGDMGLIGWLHAQHPIGCVRIDDSVAAEGRRSICLTTEQDSKARTWLVSETLQPPESGRIALSLTCRGANANSARQKQSIRVAIETARNGEPLRFSNDFPVPVDGQWSDRQIVLEVDRLPIDELTSYRIAIDSLHPGTVWIDDIRIHEIFPTAAERAQLQRDVFLSVQGMQQGNLLPAGKLLQNHWARELLVNAPQQGESRVPVELPTTDETPGVAERLRDWLPGRLRF
ncbi:hypothetical protein OAA19_02980 [Rubripirellula sp.]|nr:hypothetical protein [Rubripirellula sp.]MDB4339054.1 hypothetical protein [Rubripirellula sp.]